MIGSYSTCFWSSYSVINIAFQNRIKKEDSRVNEKEWKKQVKCFRKEFVDNIANGSMSGLKKAQGQLKHWNDDPKHTDYEISVADFDITLTCTEAESLFKSLAQKTKEQRTLLWNTMRPYLSPFFCVITKNECLITYPEFATQLELFNLGQFFYLIAGLRPIDPNWITAYLTSDKNTSRRQTTFLTETSKTTSRTQLIKKFSPRHQPTSETTGNDKTVLTPTTPTS
jgi:hypothetical protein